METKDIIRSIKRKRNRRGLKQGYVYVPYIIAESIPIIVESNFKPKTVLASRYGYTGSSKKH